MPWQANVDLINEFIDEYLKWNHNSRDMYVADKMKNFALYESQMAMAEADNKLPFVDVLDGQTKFYNIEGKTEVIDVKRKL